MKKINNFLKETSTIKFIISITAASYLIFIPLIPFFMMFFKKPYIDNFVISADDIISAIVWGSIISPIVETLIFQYGILKILKKVKVLKNKNILNIFISATMFSLAHSPNLSYRIFAFVNGVLFAYAFIIYEEKRMYMQTKLSSGWVVAIIHGLRNIIAIIFACII